MFGAIGRWFRSLGYMLTGRIDASRRGMDLDPQAMRAKYQDVINDKTKRAQEYKRAIAGLVAQQEQKLAGIKQLTEEIQRLEDLKTGALAKARQRVAELQASGADEAGVKGDEDYQKCFSAYQDFSSTLDEKNARIAEQEHDVEEYGARIKEHTLQLDELRKEIDKIRAESHEAVADVISAKQERDLNDALTGIGTDKGSEKLSELRRVRAEVKAEARVSKELAGTDHKVQEAEFLEFARKSANSNEFDKLVGLAEETDKGADLPVPDSTESESTPKQADRLPE